LDVASGGTTGFEAEVGGRVGSGWGANRQVDSFYDTELGVKLVWSIGGWDEARPT